MAKSVYSLIQISFKFILSFLLLGIPYFSQAQNSKEEAFKKGKAAVELMDKGQIEESIKLLEEARKLDPSDVNYPYEMAFAYYSDKKFQKAIDVLVGLQSHKEVNDRVFQLLGNAYDNVNQSEQAIETYEKGLKLFPKSGYLLLEMGIMHMGKKDYNKALAYFEKGIQMAPTFSSNYYWATKLYCASTEEVWGMIYGELFMNLERNSKRTSEISKLLYDTYKSEISFTSDTSFSVSFSQNASIQVEDIKKGNDLPLPFGLSVYEPTLMFACLGIKKIDLDNLNSIRSNFADLYFKNKQDAKFPNVLFSFQKKLKEAGQIEAYNYWLLMKGDEDGFIRWKEANESKWTSFVDWFTKNPLQLNESNKFYRNQYK